MLNACLFLAAASLVNAQPQTDMPPEVRKEVNYYVGNWTVEGTADGSAIRGKLSSKLSRGKHCILGDWSAKVGETPVHFALVSGWDSSTGWLTEQGIDSTGEVYTIRYRKKSPTVTEGEYTGTLAGRKLTGKVRIEKQGPTRFTLSVTEAKAGDERRPDWVLRYSKVIKQRKSKPRK